MFTQHDIDYKNNPIVTLELTRSIEGTMYTMLIILKAEICNNVQAIQTVLSGEAYGHLGLVCSPEVYQALVPGVELYICPEYQGVLEIVLKPGTNILK